MRYFFATVTVPVAIDGDAVDAEQLTRDTIAQVYPVRTVVVEEASEVEVAFLDAPRTQHRIDGRIHA